MGKKFIGFCDTLSRAGGILSGILIVAALLLILTEILIRSLFHGTLFITEEYSGYLMAALTFFALSFTLRERAHIRMVFLFSVLKGKARKVLEVYAYLVGALFSAVLTWTTFNFFWDSVVSQSRSMQISETYLAIPQSVLPLGAALLFLQFTAEAVRTILSPITESTPSREEKIEAASLGR
ncbi:MAG: TRAP transporter small permease [Spirochaetes bacterium]|nr:TRAP transporter small permease [Spirochaetota bacterium]